MPVPVEIAKSPPEVEPEGSQPFQFDVVMTSADTEYALVLPTGIRKFLVKCRDGTAFRMSFTKGKVATPIAPYLTVSAPYSEDLLERTKLIMYFACASAAKTVEVVVWT